MYEKTTMIRNRSGLHARPASDFIGCTRNFQSKIWIRRPGETEKSNAKSIVVLLTLGFCQGDEVAISAEGEDEREAVDSLIALIETGFGEV